MPAEPAVIDEQKFGGTQEGEITLTTIQAAIAHGYVAAVPGSRGRTTQNEEGNYTGKAPAAIVDLKAAVSYLRYNDDLIPGNSERIVSNGTSAGGALSALLGVTGNSDDYKPYLEELGAADADDDIYAVSAYCPITNLDNADAAYEWYFDGYYEYEKMVFGEMIDFHMTRELVQGTLRDEQIAVSEDLAALFPEYLNSLELKDESGIPLTLTASGNDGSFLDYLKSLIILSAQTALDEGADLSSCTWLTIDGSRATDVDFDSYRASHVIRMKEPAAFDGLDLGTGENNLFGTADEDNRHFTEYSLNHDTAGGFMADEQLIRMMNPMYYIGSEEVDTSAYFRIRHGAKDSDTALAIPAILALTLQNNGIDTNFAVPFEQGHAGDYDLEELFAWIDEIQ